MRERGWQPTPFFFGPPDGRLLGFYHSPSPGMRRSCGVVLCNPIGDDLVRAHRAMRRLAILLSESGIPVLRFDFHGTGDSSGDSRAHGRLERWLADIRAAKSELKARSGSEQIALVGLRFGATLAALAASQEGDVADLVLWGAYESGSAFTTEIAKVHKMHTLLEPESFSGGMPEPGGIEALGFFLPNDTIADLARVDIVAVPTKPANRALVIGTQNVPAEAKLIDHLRGLGVQLEHRHMPGSKFLITTPHEATLPDAILHTIANWLADGHPALPERAENTPLVANTSFFRADGETHRADGSDSGGERFVEFGARHPLFGILHSPRVDATTDGRAKLPAIVLLNAGTVHRIGPHRLYVGLARRWAALGFPVLRLDLSGVGDSPAAAGCADNLTYPRDGLGDVGEAMEFLRRETRRDEFVLVGLCSGADIAFDLGLDDPRIAGVVMMNPRTFCVNDLNMVAAYQHSTWYHKSVLTGASWKKLMRGEVDIARLARVLAPKVKDSVSVTLQKLKGSLQKAQGQTDPRSRTKDVPWRLERMAERGVDTFLLVTENDPGVSYVDAHYGRAMAALPSLPRFRRMDMRGTDHTFTALSAQKKVSDVVTLHLEERFVARGGA